MNQIDQGQAGADGDAAIFWTHPRFTDMSLLKARFRKHRYELHTHPTYVVALITQGCEQLRIGRRRAIATAGTIIVVNPEECHDGEPGADAGWAYRVLYPPVGLMEEWAAELGLPGAPVFCHSCIDDPVLATAVMAAHRAAETDDREDAEAALLVAMERLIRGHGDGRGCLQPTGDHLAGRRRMALYRCLLDQELDGAASLAQLAKAAGVSRFQVIRDFKQQTGLTAEAYVRNRRLREASHLIEKGAELAEAAAAAGFADQSHLSRVFRSIRGITPGMYRAAFARDHRAPADRLPGLA